MRYIIAILLICSSTQLFSMSRCPLTLRCVYASFQHHAHRPHPLTICIARGINSQSNNAHIRQELERKKLYLKRKKALLLYSRPILTVAGITFFNNFASEYSLTQPEQIAALLATATLNTGVYHAADERYNRQIQEIQSELDRLD